LIYIPPMLGLGNDECLGIPWYKVI